MVLAAATVPAAWSARSSARSLRGGSGGGSRQVTRALFGGNKADTKYISKMVDLDRRTGKTREESTSQETSKIIIVGAKGAEQVVYCPTDMYILDAATDAGVDLPFTCKAGICGACVARVVEGEVDMSDVEDLSFTLEDEQVAAGMSLLCMSRPVTAEVRLESQCDWGYLLGIQEWEGATGNVNNSVSDEWSSISEVK
mmetsp:Transcript_7794/g.28796  ORF Transcript_7794/g.28796 Transcript_7794/m.28796 type:complete len:198 (-) Transcript_7794:134-727(-)